MMVSDKDPEPFGTESGLGDRVRVFVRISSFETLGLERALESAKTSCLDRVRAFSLEKFHELVLSIADQSAGDPNSGTVKLNTVRYFSDFLAYAVLDQSMTGATDERLD